MNRTIIDKHSNEYEIKEIIQKAENDKIDFYSLDEDILNKLILYYENKIKIKREEICKIGINIRKGRL